MHASVMEWLGRSVSGDEVRGKRFLEVGSYNVNGTARDVFLPLSPASYLGIDLRLGPGVDVVADAATTLDLGWTRRFDGVVCTEVLEHAERWDRVLVALKHVLKPGGRLWLTTRGPGFPRHDYPGDHWRFTTEILGQALSDLTILELIEDPDPNSPGVLAKAQRRHPWVQVITPEAIPAP
jgi:SAM-dependent methyltransferase